MRPIRSRNAAGLALVELMIGVVLALVVLLGAGSVYIAIERTFQTGARKLRAQQEATLLSVVLNRSIRVASAFTIYEVPNRGTPADSGDGLALFDCGGTFLGRVEWNAYEHTLVDSAGARITVLRLQDVAFRRDPAEPLIVHYRYKADDEIGNLVDIESAAALRN